MRSILTVVVSNALPKKCMFQKLLTGAYSAAPRSLDRQESTTVMEFCTNFTDNIVFSLVIQCDGTRKNNMKPSRLWTTKRLTFWNDMVT